MHHLGQFVEANKKTPAFEYWVDTAEGGGAILVALGTRYKKLLLGRRAMPLLADTHSSLLTSLDARDAFARRWLRDHVAVDSDGNGVDVSILFEQLCTAMQSADLNPVKNSQMGKLLKSALDGVSPVRKKRKGTYYCTATDAWRDAPC